MVKEVNAKQFNELLASGTTFVCDFWASWCGPCRMLAPVMEAVSETYSNVTFVKVNVDEEGELAQSYGIMSIPFVAMFTGGKLKATSVGYVPEDDMLAFVSANL